LYVLRSNTAIIRYGYRYRHRQLLKHSECRSAKKADIENGSFRSKTSLFFSVLGLCSRKEDPQESGSWRANLQTAQEGKGRKPARKRKRSQESRKKREIPRKN
jgi:hypothetical protein